MHYLEILSTSISIISLIIVIYGAIIAFCAFIHNESRRFTGKYSFTATRELRADLGTYLLLGLEFLIASDILKTVLEPSLNELGNQCLEHLVNRSVQEVVGIHTDVDLQARRQDVYKRQPCSVYLEGEYGESDLCIGVPVILGKNGIRCV